MKQARWLKSNSKGFTSTTLVVSFATLALLSLFSLRKSIGSETQHHQQVIDELESFYAAEVSATVGSYNFAVIRNGLGSDDSYQEGVEIINTFQGKNDLGTNLFGLPWLLNVAGSSPFRRMNATSMAYRLPASDSTSTGLSNGNKLNCGIAEVTSKSRFRVCMSQNYEGVPSCEDLDFTPVNEIYLSLLGREMGTGDKDAWRNALLGGDTGVFRLLNLIRDSQEYKDRGGENAENVTVLYRSLFGRLPSSTELLEGVRQVSKSDLKKYATTLSQGNTSPSPIVVQELFRMIFGSEPSQVDVDKWAPLLNSGDLDYDGLFMGLKGTKEYKALSITSGVAIGVDTTKVTDDYLENVFLYRLFLHRFPEPSGISYWTWIRNRGGTQQFLAKSFRSSEEYKKQGCYVSPPPAPGCQIRFHVDSAQVGTPANFTLTAWGEATAISTSPIVSVGPYSYNFQKDFSVTFSSSGKNKLTATVSGPGGTTTCEDEIDQIPPQKLACDIWYNVQGNNDCGPGGLYVFGVWIGKNAKRFQWKKGGEVPVGSQWDMQYFIDYGSRTWHPGECLPRDPKNRPNTPPDRITYQGVEYKLSTNGQCGSDDCQCHRHSASPLIVDLAGTGIQLTQPKQGRIFELEAVGTKQRYAWPKRNAGNYFIAFDKNKNSKVDSIQELFGNNTTGPDGKIAENGFDSLAKFDSNKDGRIDRLDAIYSQLLLWDGYGKLISLSKMGIESIELQYKEEIQYYDNFGNLGAQHSVVQLKTGAKRIVSDVWLVSGE